MPVNALIMQIIFVKHFQVSTSCLVCCSELRGSKWTLEGDAALKWLLAMGEE